ncbi:ABC transporter ATP-binding protein [Rhizohabitans arisaemae]|uniref:ABC transporter ATP-binding protein n=1 Tax=Rhizohabitans arisaemae TaxID=2720610 RepID=UPI0024B2100D|nr:ABC transporter ATP-binding protein [Rhizohabitans arisaemae]
MTTRRPVPAGEDSPAVRLCDITKTYDAFRANDHVTLDVARGTIHGLLGENGAGKSTLMNILNGSVRPDGGRIEVDGRPVRLRTTSDARAAGIGMVHQHFSLIDRLTVVENLALVARPSSWPRRCVMPVDLVGIEERARLLADRLRFAVDPRARCGSLGVGARQRVEIMKALWHHAQVVIMDEPTASLSPVEAQELLSTLLTLREQGATVILISHKMPEILAVCDEVTVLRDGRVSRRLSIGADDRDPGPRRDRLEADLVQAMIGRPRPDPPARAAAPGSPRLVLHGVGDGARVGPVDLSVHAGEIVAVAGVEGNGQAELIELIVGVRRLRTGRVLLGSRDVSSDGPRTRLACGLGHIAEDRHAAAIATRMSVTANAAFGFVGARMGRRWWLPARTMRAHAGSIVDRMSVRLPGLGANIEGLSGGNQQKLVVGRELARDPSVLIAGQPTRGLDIGAAGDVHRELAALRDGGAGVLLVSMDLTEVLAVADRIVVMRSGRIVGDVPAADADVDTLGGWMTGAQPSEQKGVQPSEQKLVGA